MVRSEGSGWKKRYYHDTMSKLNDVWNKSKLPKKIILPVSSRNSMFEMGGTNTVSGTALVIGTPSGFPNSAIIPDHRHVNGIHAISRVWNGCLIGIAHHDFGRVTAGIYRLKSIKVDDSNPQRAGVFTHVCGITRADQTVADDINWVVPYDIPYKGIRRMARALLRKVFQYECTKAFYVEPLRVVDESSSKEPKLSTILQYTDLDLKDLESELTPWYVKIMRNMSEMVEHTSYRKFEAQAVSICDQYYPFWKFVYLILYHHVSYGELQTHGYIAYQKQAGGMLHFHPTGLVYRHQGLEYGYSTDLQSYISMTYNSSYFGKILGVKRSSVKALLDRMERTKDHTHYAFFRYVYCNKSYDVTNIRTGGRTK